MVDWVGMQTIISHAASPQPQRITQEWYGNTINPHFVYCFTHSADGLEFCAARKAPALVHPEGVCGHFQAELWRYDAAEFFIATPDGSRYMEFNLSPNGAWWAAVFCAPRQTAPGFENWIPAGVLATGESKSEGWICRALIPYTALEQVGIDIKNCKLTAAAILNSPEQIFLTTALPCDTQPDFHRPDLWETALLS